MKFIKQESSEEKKGLPGGRNETLTSINKTTSVESTSDDYEEVELTDEEIDFYKSQGFFVEEIEPTIEKEFDLQLPHKEHKDHKGIEAHGDVHINPEHIMGHASIGTDKVNIDFLGSTPTSAQERKYHLGNIASNLNYKVNDNLSLSGGLNLEPHKKPQVNVGLKYKFNEGGEFDKEEYGWQYKKEGDKYLTRKSGDTDWITATGDPLNHIKSKVYGEIVQNFDPSVVQSSSKSQKTKVKSKEIQDIQNELLDNDYYLGGYGADGIDGEFTQDALAAYQSGISSEDYNKQFGNTKLPNSNITVPNTIINNTNGIKNPVAPTLSETAQQSLNQNIEADLEQDSDVDPLVTSKTSKKEEEKGVRVFSEEGDYFELSSVPDLDDRIYQHADDFIIEDFDNSRKYYGGTEFSNPEQKKIHKQFKYIDRKTGGSCLAGALNCNSDFVSVRAGAPSIRQLMEDHDNWVRADLSKYSVKSGDLLDSENSYEHTKGYDSWEIGDALVGEGLAKDLWVVSDEEAKNVNKHIPDSFRKLIDEGRIPVGTMLFQGTSLHDGYTGYTSKKDGNRARHSMTVVGFDKDGTPLVYETGNLMRIDDTKYGGHNFVMNRMIVPNGYENYTFENLKKGKAERYKQLGYDANPEEIKYTDNKEYKPYVNGMKKAMHNVEYKVANDYDIDKSVMDKISNRVIGHAAQESNFNNQGEDTKPFFSTNPSHLFMGSGMKIATEGYLQDLGKGALKLGYDLFNIEEEGGVYDYQVQMQALKNLKNKNINPYAIGKTKKADGTSRTLLDEEFNKLRESGDYPKPDKDYGNYTSSTGPLQIKKVPSYVTETFGISKGDLYGSNIDDNKELGNSSIAALVLLTENYKKYKAKYQNKYNLTDDDLIDIASIAYNSASKPNNDKFIETYIKNKELADGYLSKVRRFEAAYTNTEDLYNKGFTEKINLAQTKPVQESPTEQYVMMQEPKINMFRSDGTIDTSGLGSIFTEVNNKPNPSTNEQRFPYVASLEKGGEFVDMELTEDEIKAYIAKGYRIEELE